MRELVLANKQKKVHTSIHGDNEKARLSAVEDGDSKTSKTQSKIYQLISEYGELPLSNTELSAPGEPTPEMLLAILPNALLLSTLISRMRWPPRRSRQLSRRGYHKLDVLKSTWDERTQVLTEGGYAHYKYTIGLSFLVSNVIFVTYTTMMRDLAELLEDKYGKHNTRDPPTKYIKRIIFDISALTAEGDFNWKKQA